MAPLKRHGLIDGAIRAPQPGAPFAYVTTRKFLEAFGFAWGIGGEIAHSVFATGASESPGS